MTKDEAIKFMDLGFKVTHQYFAKDEWMCKFDENNYQFEDEILCEFEEFWYFRDDAGWNLNWKIVI